MAFGQMGWNPVYGGYMPQPMGQMGAMPDQLAQLRAQPYNAAQQTTQGTPIWVQGEAGAKSYGVAPGSNVLLMDSEAEVFYIKSADASGVPLPLRIFDYKERVASVQRPAQAAQTPTAEYVTRAEFDAFVARLTGVERNQTEQTHHRRPQREETVTDG